MTYSAPANRVTSRIVTDPLARIMRGGRAIKGAGLVAIGWFIGSEQWGFLIAGVILVAWGQFVIEHATRRESSREQIRRLG